jgi:hypothetical protein
MKAEGKLLCWPDSHQLRWINTVQKFSWLKTSCRRSGLEMNKTSSRLFFPSHW